MAHKQHGGTWTERTGYEAPSTEADDIGQQFDRQTFQNHHSSMGAVHTHASGFGVAGHIIHMAGVFIPVVAGELIQDATKYKKVVRLASIGTAMAYEGMYVYKEHQKAKEQAEKLAECRGRE